MNISFSAAFVFLCLSLKGQNLRVLSERDSIPIPYACLVLYEDNKVVGGTYSNVDGQLFLDTSIAYSTVKISHVAFKTKIIKGNVESIRTVFLQSDETYLNEVVVTATKPENLKLVSYGYPKKWRKVLVGAKPGFSVITRMDFKKNEGLRELKTLSFHLSDTLGNSGLLLRPLVYSDDKGRPGNEILIDTVYRLNSELDGYVSVKLPSGIKVYGKSVFIGLELIECYSETSVDSNQNFWENDPDCYMDLVGHRAKNNSNTNLSYFNMKFFADGWRVLLDEGNQVVMALKVEVLEEL
jgi:hypothetical protein